MKLDRGQHLTGYYVTDPATQRKLYGKTWENSFPCGTYVAADSTVKAITFIMFLANDPAIDDVDHAESFDLNLEAEAALAANQVYLDLMADKLPNLSVLKEKIKAEIEAEIAEGKEKPEIAKDKKKSLVGEYLGATLANVIADWPIVWQPTTDAETGTEVPNIMRCSLEDS